MKLIIPILLLFLVGCSGIELSKECIRYADTKQISSLAGIHIMYPAEVIETKNDCSARYKISDTSFDLYYWTYSSDDEFYTSFNHSLIRTSNCRGSLCQKIYEFHYLGPPRQLEVTCRQGKITMHKGEDITEKEIDCNVLKTIGKFNQKTWPCDYNAIMKTHCK